MAQPSPLLRVDGLRKVYRTRRGREVVAVEGASFAVHQGEIVGLLGSNGAGKTTTIKCIATLVRPSDGQIDIAGIDVRREPRAAVAKVAAVLEGNRNIYWRLTVKENLEFFGALQGLPPRVVNRHIDDLVALLRLERKRDVPARHLSKGMQQKLAIACCLIRRTSLLLLDEPTLGLDIETTYELRSYIKELLNRGKTILLSSHDMTIVEDLCERVIALNAGRVVTDDKVANLLELFRARAYRFQLLGQLTASQSRTLRERFGVEILEESDRTNIDVQLPDNAAIYELIAVLEEGRSVIESIDRRDPNLGEIVLRITKGRDHESRGKRHSEVVARSNP